MSKLDQIRELRERKAARASVPVKGRGSPRRGMQATSGQALIAADEATEVVETVSTVPRSGPSLGITGRQPRHSPSATGQRETKSPERAGAALGPERGKPQAPGFDPPGRPTRPGRPRIEDRDKTLAALKPWAALGMSERTWYRRQQEKRS